MRRNIRNKPLMLAVAVVFLAGCSNSSSPDLADAGNATEAENDIALPDASEAVNMVTGEKVGVQPASEPEAALPEIADGADSDTPGSYQASPAEQASNELPEEAQPLTQAVGEDGAPKSNGRTPDGDDPNAPLIIAKNIETQEDAPLDNGRGDSAQPIPEGQRVAVASESVGPTATQLGRDTGAKPGAELTNPPKATPTPTPTTKPAAPTRKTLADLSEAIQALDKDGDGQLGVYEWPREKLAEFKTLDTNKDGFLTPAELVAGQKKATDAEAAKTGKEPAAKSEEKAPEKAKEETKEEAAPKADDSAKQEDAKAPAADSTDKEQTKDESKEEKKEETPAASADGADSKDDSSADDQPKQGS